MNTELAHFAVLGDWIADVTVTCRVRGSASEDETALVVCPEATSRNLGGAANVAANLNSLAGADAHRVVAFGRASWHPLSDGMLAALNAAKIEHAWWASSNHRIPVKTRYVTADGRQLLRVDAEDDWPAVEEQPRRWDDDDCGDSYVVRLKDLLVRTPPTVVELVDYNKGYFTGDHVEALLRRLDRHPQTPVLVDPGRSGVWHHLPIPQAVFKVNYDQALAFLGRARPSFADRWRPRPRPGHQDACEAFALDLLTAVRSVGTSWASLSAVWVTFGVGGMAYAASTSPDGTGYFPAHPAEAVADVCGAGDTALAAAAYSFAAQGVRSHPTQAQLHKAVEFANRAAGVAVRRRGVYVIKREDLGL